MPSPLRKFIAWWELTQVELHGSYSSERVLALARYTRETSWLHVIIVLVVTPLPGLAITVLSDVLPLANPLKGLHDNSHFIIREYYCYVVMTFLAIQQFRTSVRALPYPNWRATMNSIVVAALSTGVQYLFGLAIGFPVPFSIVIAMPVWVVILSISMAIEWLQKIRETPGSGMMVINTIKVWLVEVLLVVTYPPYYFVFTTLSKTGQMMFASLLPVIKLIMRNIFTRTVVHLSDEMPEVVVFNSEVFNTLFVAYCMQNSPSIGTTLMVTAALLLQLVLSLRDVNDALRVMGKVARKLAHENVYELVQKSSEGGRVITALDRAEAMLRQQHQEEDALQQGGANKTTDSRNSLRVQSLQKLGSGVDTEQSVNNLAAGARIQPAPLKLASEQDLKKQSATSVQYTLAVQQLLYLTEFLVLINYVGVFIPLIFCVYMGLMYQLPNREYYAQLADLTQEELTQALQNVLFNCSLKLLALLLLCGVLKYKLRFSALHQLAFVVEGQWPGVQTKICFWVFYNVQASLQHHGTKINFDALYANLTVLLRRRRDAVPLSRECVCRPLQLEELVIYWLRTRSTLDGDYVKPQYSICLRQSNRLSEAMPLGSALVILQLGWKAKATDLDTTCADTIIMTNLAVSVTLFLLLSIATYAIQLQDGHVDNVIDAEAMCCL